MKAAIAVVAFAGLQLSASAQSATKEITRECPEFTAINVANDFDVTLCQGDAYQLVLTVDEDLSPYVFAEVKGKTLTISFDEKNVAKEIKQKYKKEKITPIFHAIITMPVLESITLSNNVVLNTTTPFECPDKFELTVTDKAQVKNLAVSAMSANLVFLKEAKAVINLNTNYSAEVSTEDKSDIRLTTFCGELVVNSVGSSRVSVTNTSSKINVATKGSSQVSVSGSCTAAVVNAEGSSKLTLSGKGSSLNLKAAKSANVDAYGLEVESASIDMAGSANVNINASDNVELSLTGGKLTFGGSPLFKIAKISKATVTPYGSAE